MVAPPEIVAVPLIVTFGVAGAVMTYAEVTTPEFTSPDFVARALSVMDAGTEMGPEYVVPWVHVPGVLAAGVDPSFVQQIVAPLVTVDMVTL
jgi:hypothetical protein